MITTDVWSQRSLKHTLLPFLSRNQIHIPQLSALRRWQPWYCYLSLASNALEMKMMQHMFRLRQTEHPLPLCLPLADSHYLSPFFEKSDPER